MDHLHEIAKKARSSALILDSATVKDAISLINEISQKGMADVYTYVNGKLYSSTTAELMDPHFPVYDNGAWSSSFLNLRYRGEEEHTGKEKYGIESNKNIFVSFMPRNGDVTRYSPIMNKESVGIYVAEKSGKNIVERIILTRNK